MYEKNQKVTLDIVDMTSDGLGIGKKDSYVFFVKNALIGDKVEAVITKSTDKSKVIYAKVTDILEESKYRMKPKCDVCDACGGCQVLSLSYDKQLELKENIVKNNLKRIAGLPAIEINEKFMGIIGMDNPYHYRNKVQVPFAFEDGKVISGFYAGRTHHIVENEGCAVSFDAAYRIIAEVKKYLEESDKLTIYNEKSGYGKLRELMIRQANTSHEISITFIVNDKKKDKSIYMPLVDRLLKINSNIRTVTLNINTGNNNVLFGNENIILYGNGFIEDEVLSYKFRVSPESFYQVNNVQTEKLYNTVLDFAKDIDVENALDLYCGIGTITLILSKVAKHITGLEIVEKAIENANANAKLNGVSNVDFICADAGDVEKYLDKKYDLISIDPPRKGLDIKTIDFIKKQSPQNLIYVSCDPATLSRDIKLLSDTYDIKKIKCVDMFPHTMHVETVALMSKK